jgi:hypothetical protein
MAGGPALCDNAACDSCSAERRSEAPGICSVGQLIRMGLRNFGRFLRLRGLAVLPVHCLMEAFDEGLHIERLTQKANCTSV